MDVDLVVVEGFKHGRGNAGVLGHTGADDGNLGHIGGDVHGGEAEILLIFLENLLAQVLAALGDGEGDVLGVVAADGLQNHVHIDLGLGQETEHLIGHARHILQPDEGNAGDLLVLRHAADEGFFHFYDLLDDSTGVSGET